MGKGKGDDYDPRYWAGWSSSNPCECGTENYVAVSVRHIEVRMCSDGKRYSANAGRTILGICTLGISEAAFGHFQDITLEAIEVVYKCEWCMWAYERPVQFRRTYEIVNDDVDEGEMGKFREWGYYSTELGQEDSITHPFRYAELEEIFEEMWDARDYHLRDNNCKDWSKDFMSKLRDHY